jgi:adenylylsulfate kinase-like enzyme
MTSPPPAVFVITGQLAAGKSTLARALLDRFPSGYHVDLDGIREMVSSGFASPLAWSDETVRDEITRQFGLAVQGAAALARVYHAAGFVVAIEGGMEPRAIQRALADEELEAHLVGVILHPTLDVALRRNRDRTTKGFDTSVLDDVIREIDADLSREPILGRWTRIDNGEESVGQTVERVLALVEGSRPPA